MTDSSFLQNKAINKQFSAVLQILNLLYANGAQLPSTKGKEVVITAVQHNEFHVVEKLIEIGADPQGLSLEPGDTPLHAALAVALDKEKGERGILL